VTCVAIDFRVLVYRERYDDSNIMGELFLRPDCTFEQVRQIIAEVRAVAYVLQRQLERRGMDRCVHTLLLYRNPASHRS
jgi:hypothetical protein